MGWFSFRVTSGYVVMLNFACVYYGDKYQIEYVEKLYNMVQRNTTLEHKFICFTDNTVIRRRFA